MCPSEIKDENFLSSLSLFREELEMDVDSLQSWTEAIKFLLEKIEMIKFCALSVHIQFCKNGKFS
jgi:hypothetical protein